MKTSLKVWWFTNVGLLACVLFIGCAGSKAKQTSSSSVAPAASGTPAPLAYQWYFNAGTNTPTGK